jgi:hypothetical protein
MAARRSTTKPQGVLKSTISAGCGKALTCINHRAVVFVTITRVQKAPAPADSTGRRNTLI